METLLAHCTAAFSGHGGLFAVFFLGGLTGSVTHCLTMCGPIVACQSACGGSCSRRFDSVSQWRYHAGRMLTYGALGFLAALMARPLTTLEQWPSVAAIMLVLAGAMFIASSFPACNHSIFKLSGRSNFMRGVLMGFMPCGLLYAALMMAATLGNPLVALFAMWLFVLGTVPVLLLASVSADMITQQWKQKMVGAGRALMAFNGLSLFLIAARMMR